MSFGTKTVYASIDDYVTPIVTKLIESVTTKLDNYNIEMKTMSGGLPESGQLLDGIDKEKAPLTDILNVYKAQKTANKITPQFEKQIRTCVESVSKDMLRDVKGRMPPID